MELPSTSGEGNLDNVEAPLSEGFRVINDHLSGSDEDDNYYANQDDDSYNNNNYHDDSNEMNSEEDHNYELNENEFSLAEYVNAESVANSSTSLTQDQNSLGKWFLQNNITRAAGNELLTILSNFDATSLTQLPKDIRTITSKLQYSLSNNENKIKVLEPGLFLYFGVERVLQCPQAIDNLYDSGSRSIDLSINIDGIPISKSSKKCFWPILAACENYDVILVALYYGPEKPRDVDAFLSDFVTEINYLNTKGLVLNNQNYTIAVKNIVADLPAKSYILGCIGHTGYGSCTKCRIQGVNSCNRITFPDEKSESRENSDYNELVDKQFHKKKTILTNLPGINLVTDVVIDYMHAICLGTVRRLTQVYLGSLKSSTIQRVISTADENRISKRLQKLFGYCPSDFPRKPRTLEIAHWKATEWRMWLLYTGPIVLKGILQENYYEHFTILSYCIRLLSSKRFEFSEDIINYVENLLHIFLQQSSDLFGHWFITSSVHAIIHLPKDCLKFGCIDNFSSFKFENFLFNIKNQLKSGNQPLKQIENRYFGLLSSGSTTKKFQMINRTNVEFRRAYSPTDSEIIDIGWVCENAQFFREINFKSIHLKTDKLGDQFCISDGGALIKVFYIIKFPSESSRDEIKIVGKKFSQVNNIFEKPSGSNLVGLYEASNLSPKLEHFSFSTIRCKLFPMQLINVETFFLAELLH